MSDVIEVKKREETGTLRMRRLRDSGWIPAVVYGQGAECVSVSVATRDVDRMIRDGRHIVELSGDVKQSALIKDVQWDAFGSEVLHLDFARIDAAQAIEISLGVELRGDAPGTKSGGIVKHQLHELLIRCPASDLPESLEVNINDLQLGDVITAGDVPLPNGAELLSDAADVVVTCVEPDTVSEDSESTVEGHMEPEVIGRKADDESEDDS